MSEQSGSAPLAVGGVGRGALAARHTLVHMERQHMDHQTAHYFSYNGTAPSQDESTELEQLGEWPVRPMKLKLVTTDSTSDLRDDDFDDNTSGDADPGGRLITSPHGSWLLDHLDR